MKFRKFDLTVMVTCLALLGYLAWHGFYGPRSFAHRDALVVKVAELETELGVAASGRQQLDQRVKLMRPESLDPDMLEQLVRQDLNFLESNELLLIQK